ncbi:hypothetical protein UP10_39015 [Bradyrhizobium sp. LTSPM299]|nr:hypothetical protein UP10_39015 [Bradyrhizobium sp. LTSPM299]
MVTTRFLKCALILELLLLPTGILADPFLESGVRCTHFFGLDQIVQAREPVAAALNAIQDTRKIYIARLGKPTFEKQVLDGVTLSWVTTEGNSIPIARNVVLQIVQGTLHVTCGTAF